MTEKKVRKLPEEILPKVADNITEKPETFILTKKVFFFGEKLLIKLGLLSNKRVFKIEPQRVINIYRIAGRVVTINTGNAFKTIDRIGVLMDVMSRHGKDIFYIVACMIQNDHNEPTEKMLKIVENELEMSDLLTILKIAVSNYDVADFLTSITLIVGVDALKLEEQVSPKVQGS